MKQKIDSFINSIRTLRALESDLALLKYISEQNNTSLNILSNSYDLITATNGLIIKTISSHINNPANNYTPEIPLIAKNINSIITNITSLPDNAIPGKKELIAMLESCKTPLLEQEFTYSLTSLTNNKTEFHKENLILGDICAAIF